MKAGCVSVTVGSRKENCSSLFPNLSVYNAPILCSRLVACYTGKWINSVNGIKSLFLFPLKKFLYLGHASCFWVDRIGKLHFFRRLGEMFYWIFYFFLKCALFLLQTKQSPSWRRWGSQFTMENKPYASFRPALSLTVFSRFPVVAGQPRLGWSVRPCRSGGQRVAVPQKLLQESCLLPSHLLFSWPALEFGFNILFLPTYRATETFQMTHSAENNSELILL